MQQTSPPLPPRYQDADWGRLPRAGRTGQPGGRLRGLSRSTLLELDKQGLIKIIALRTPGSVKAIRLIFLPSLDSYLHKLATGEIPEQLSRVPLKESSLKKQPAKRKFP